LALDEFIDDHPEFYEGKESAEPPLLNGVAPMQKKEHTNIEQIPIE
jgi:hypothetical protein